MTRSANGRRQVQMSGGMCRRAQISGNERGDSWRQVSQHADVEGVSQDIHVLSKNYTCGSTSKDKRRQMSNVRETILVSVVDI